MPSPIEIQCPNCSKTLKLKNDSAVGKKVPCPKCKKPFVIELPQADDDEFVEDDMELLDDFDDMDDDDFGDPDEMGAPGEGAPKSAPPAAEGKSGKKLWWIIGGSVAAVVCIGGVAAFLLFGSGNSADAVAGPGPGGAGGNMPGAGNMPAGMQMPSGPPPGAQTGDGGPPSPQAGQAGGEKKIAKKENAGGAASQAGAPGQQPGTPIPAGQPGAPGPPAGTPKNNSASASLDAAISNKLQGAWKVTGASVSGRSLPDFIGGQYTFSKDELLVVGKSGGTPSRSKFAVDASAKPVTLNSIVAGKTSFEGIIQINKDILRLCFAVNGERRPKEFVSKSKNVLSLMLQRADVSTKTAGTSLPGAPKPGAPKSGTPKPGTPKTGTATTAGAAKSGLSQISRDQMVKELEKSGLKFKSGQPSRGFPSMVATGSIGKVDSQWTLVGSRKQLVEMAVTVGGLRMDAQNALKRMPALLQSYAPWVDQKLVGSVKKDKPLDVTRDGVHLEISMVEETNKVSWTLSVSAVGPDGGPVTIGSKGFVGVWQVESAVEKMEPTTKYNDKFFGFNDAGEAGVLKNTVDDIEYSCIFEVELSRTPKRYSVWKGARIIQRGIFKQEEGKLYLCFTRGKSGSSIVDPKEVPKTFTTERRSQTILVLKPVMSEEAQPEQPQGESN